IRFLSWNIRGMGNPIKRSRVFTHLKRLRAEIVFLQETHLRVRDHHRLHRPWVGQTFHSNFNSKARGVAILVNRSIQFSPTHTIADRNGRYVIVAGMLMQTKVLLVNIYAPNFDDPDFANRLIGSLPFVNTHLIVLGGDLNCVLNPVLDRSSSRAASQSAMSKSFSNFVSQNGLVDPWRCRNPGIKKFSFFSPVHHSYSRIDYFFIDSRLNRSVVSTDYLAIVISDHAPLALDIQFSTHRPTQSPWRFNSHLLADKDFCASISEAIDEFLLFNRLDSTPCSLLWETLKAFLRGRIISYSAFTCREHRAKLRDISSAISQLDQSYASNPSPELYKQRVELQAEFDLLSTRDTECMLLRTRGSYYEYGDKPSRLLAHQLRRQAASRLIPQINNDLNVTVTDPMEINAVFKSYYSALYKSECLTDSKRLGDFLQGVDFPVVDTVSVKDLDSPLSLDEVRASIKAMQSNKAPGPDGFPVEFLKKFIDKLAPLLLGVFNESLDQGVLPPTFNQASIALLLKKGKDPNLCGSYRPLSLLNADVKVLAKVIASRLENVLPRIISMEQTGFIKGRHSFFNTRTLFNIIYSKQSSPLPEVVVSLDAEKAFDRVEWEYLFAILKKFGFGDTFVSWIRLLYKSPQASVRTNNVSSDYFSLGRGTRQGCPLSPLLFALAIEPLSVKLKSSLAFKGVTRKGAEYKVSLYADDLLLYVTDPAASIPVVLSILGDFGSFSGYKLNFPKSECYPVNSTALQLQRLNLPFKFNCSGFKYLGITVTRSLPKLFHANLAPLVADVKSDFQRWSSLPLSLTGKINAVKMNVLPKFLYFFQSLPLFLPKYFFYSLDRIINSFLWSGKPPRIRKTLLQRCRLSGGLALPNFQIYYWAAHIQKLNFWSDSAESTWCNLELLSCRSSSVSALLCSPFPVKPYQYTDNPVVLNTLKIWFQFRRHFKFRALSALGPLNRNNLFHPSLLDSAFSLWHEKGVKQLYNLYKDGVFRSFTSLSLEYGLPTAHFF
ncbi:hypothetical protein C0J50_8261, partial [Silurus asotus]